MNADFSSKPFWGSCLLIVLMPFLMATAAEGKSSGRFLWEDVSDGLFSLNATCISADPTNPTIVYGAANGILYRSKNGGLTWLPLVRFSGSARTQVQRLDIQERLRRIKEQILEEKLEDLAAEVGEERAEELRGTLERDAEEEAEEQLRQQQRSRRITQGPNNRFRRTITRILVSRKNPKLLLIATNGGAFVSNDGGQTFRRSFRGRGGGLEGNVGSALLDPNNPKVMFVGTGRGLWASRDGGKFWKRVFGKLRTLPIREIRRDPNQLNIIYVATPRAVFVSYDSGKNFREKYTPTSSGPQRITTLAVLPTRPKTTILLGTGNGLYTSKDAVRFRPLTMRGLGSRRVIYMTTSASDPSRVYLINERGAFQSKNQGRTFRQMRVGMITQGIRFLAIHPKKPEHVWAATDFGFYQWSRRLAGKLTQVQWQRFRRKIGLEPTPWMVAQAVIRYMKLNVKLGKMHSRYRLRGFLPRISIRAQLNLDRDQTNLVMPKNISDRILEGRAFYLQAIASWPLAFTVFAQRETAVVGQMRSLQRTRDRMLTRAIRLYHARRRLQLRLFANPPKTLPKYMKRLLKLKEVTAYLDGMTGGYITRKQQLIESRGSQ